MVGYGWGREHNHRLPCLGGTSCVHAGPIFGLPPSFHATGRRALHSTTWMPKHLFVLGRPDVQFRAHVPQLLVCPLPPALFPRYLVVLDRGTQRMIWPSSRGDHFEAACSCRKKLITVLSTPNPALASSVQRSQYGTAVVFLFACVPFYAITLLLMMSRASWSTPSFTPISAVSDCVWMLSSFSCVS